MTALAVRLLLCFLPLAEGLLLYLPVPLAAWQTLEFWRTLHCWRTLAAVLGVRSVTRRGSLSDAGRRVWTLVCLGWLLVSSPGVVVFWFGWTNSRELGRSTHQCLLIV